MAIGLMNVIRAKYEYKRRRSLPSDLQRTPLIDQTSTDVSIAVKDGL